MATQTGKEKKKTGGKVGKPPINDPDDVSAIQAKIDAYFDGLRVLDEETGETEPPTFCGLAIALGYCDRSTLWKTSTANTNISKPVKKAMLMIEEYAERRAYGNNAAGPIFIMKNRGWSDKQEIEHSGTIAGKLTPEERKVRIDVLRAKLDR